MTTEKDSKLPAKKGRVVKTEAETTEKKKAPTSGSALKFLQSINPYAAFLEDSELTNVASWIDTGNYVLNALVSGSIYGGVPNNKVTLIAGESTTGKTLICARILAAAQKLGFIVVWVDTEFAVGKKMARNMGLDPKKLIHLPVKSIEHCRNTLIQFLKNVETEGELGRYIICVDSLANMESEMELTRIEKDSSSSDMGTKARAIGSLLRNLNNYSAFTQTPVILTNHVYDNPGDPFAKFNLIKSQPGGKKVMFIPSVSIQLTKRNIKEEDAVKYLGGTELTVGQEKYSGAVISALSVKNRFAKPFMSVDMFLSYETGLSPYAGVSELAEAFGIIVEGEKKTWFLNGEAIGKRHEWIDDAETYKKMLDPLEAKIKSDWQYSSEYEDKLQEAEDIAEKENRE